MTSQNSGVSIRSGSSSVSSTSALESGDPGSNPWVGLNLFQNLASKSEGKSGSFECKQPKVGKSYTTSFLVLSRYKMGGKSRSPAALEQVFNPPTLSFGGFDASTCFIFFNVVFFFLLCLYFIFDERKLSGGCGMNWDFRAHVYLSTQ